MFHSLFGSLLNHLYPYANENVSVRHLSLSCITSILTTIYSLKNCSVYGRSCRIYSPKWFWFSWRISSSLKKINVFSRLRSQFFTIRTSQPANNMYLWYYSSIHPSIYLVRICLFFFWKGEERERFYILFALSLPTCPSSPTPS